MILSIKYVSLEFYTNFLYDATLKFYNLTVQYRTHGLASEFSIPVSLSCPSASLSPAFILLLINLSSQELFSLFSLPDQTLWSFTATAREDFLSDCILALLLLPSVVTIIVSLTILHDSMWLPSCPFLLHISLQSF